MEIILFLFNMSGEHLRFWKMIKGKNEMKKGNQFIHRHRYGSKLACTLGSFCFGQNIYVGNAHAKLHCNYHLHTGYPETHKKRRNKSLISLNIDVYSLIFTLNVG